MISIFKRAESFLPSNKEKKAIEKEVNDFVDFLNKRIKKLNLDAEVFIGGGWAKDTWLSDPDIDIFLRFERERNIGRAEEILKGLEYEVVHGSRDYFKYKRFEIVPILKIKHFKEAKNITDLSPFHVDFVRDNLKRPRDVKLLKLFCKAADVYGAESYIGGFSGYALELLIIKYRSIKRLFEAVESWKPKVVIDFGKREKLNEHKRKSPLIIYDPTYPGRNVSAALEYRNFSKFVFSVRSFLRKPSLKFFSLKKRTIQDIRKLSEKRGTKLFLKKIRIKGNKEVFLSKLRKDMKKIKSCLVRNGFSVYDYGFFECGNMANVFFELENWEISKKGKHFGPPVWIDKKHFDEFLKKWGNVYVEGERMVADKKRENNGIRLLKKIMKEHDYE